MHFKNILLLTSLSFVLIACGSNPPPSLASIADQTTNQSTAKAVALVVNTYNAGGTLTYSATSDNADVVISVSGSTLTLTPIPTWNGSATITAKVNDGFYDSAAQTFALTTLDPLATYELIDPNAAAGNQFSSEVAILGNGNIVTVSVDDSTYFADNGAVHLYNPYTQKLIKSYYGNAAEDELGSSGVLVLYNNNFVIATDDDDVDGIEDAGSIMLIDGTTGEQIGLTISGDKTNDSLGSSRFKQLTNNNFVITSRYDDLGASGANEGSVMLINGTTGALIATITGDNTNDYLGSSEIVALPNGNFVVASEYDNVGGLADAGSVMLVNGTTGAVIANFTGDKADDELGGSDIDSLGNNNFVIASQYDDLGASGDDEGSVMLVNGTTGALIKTITGDQANDYIGNKDIKALYWTDTNDGVATNNYNFVVVSPDDNVGVVSNAGSVMLVNGTTGDVIATISGDNNNDALGNRGVEVLSNGNFVVASDEDNVGVVSNAGSVMLVNGKTGAVIATISGDNDDDELASSDMDVLANDNFVISSKNVDVGALADVGSVMLVNGTTGAVIATIFGDAADDRLGNNNTQELTNGNFVIASAYDHVGGLADAGSVMLVNGTTGAVIATISGEEANDELGDGNVAFLYNGDFVVVSRDDNEGGVDDAGSFRHYSGTTGAQIGSTFAGTTSYDMSGTAGVRQKSYNLDLSPSFYVVYGDQWDQPGKANAGIAKVFVY